MRASHVSVQEITACTVSVGVRRENLIAAGSGTYPQGIIEVTSLCLCVGSVTPCDGQNAVVVVQGRLGRSRRASISRCTGNRINRRCGLTAQTIYPNLSFAVTVQVFGIDSEVGRTVIEFNGKRAKGYRVSKLQIIITLQPDYFGVAITIVVVTIKSIIGP